MENDKELNKEPMTSKEAIVEVRGKLNEVIEKVNKIANFLEGVFGEEKSGKK